MAMPLDEFTNNDWDELVEIMKNFLKEKGYDEVESFKSLEQNRVVSFTALDDGEGDTLVPVRIQIDWDVTGL